MPAARGIIQGGAPLPLASDGEERGPAGVRLLQLDPATDTEALDDPTWERRVIKWVQAALLILIKRGGDVVRREREKGKTISI